ncbi:unnamed protein product [Ilex paraguariensis]|uniref:Uncharacterized protein n=1 Tax=Ilex paraguariensis TaxID=185542 RepID=A0ABC8RY64_9AQUA
MEIDEMPSLERDDMIPLGCTDVDNILCDQPMENLDEENDNFISYSDIEEDSYSDDIEKDDKFINNECDSNQRWPDWGNKELLGVVEDYYHYYFQASANGSTLSLARESHCSMSVHIVPFSEGHVEHNVEIVLAKKKQASEKLNVEMPEELGQIVGLECQALITKLGCIIRKHAPLQMTKWAKIDKDNGDSLVQMAKEQMVELQPQLVGEDEAPVCEEKICLEVLGHK